MKWMQLITGCCLALSLVMTGCSKESEVLRLPLPGEYYPMVIGRSLIYRLDSFVIPQFSGTELGMKTYHARDSIADTTRDNIGRLSYRVYRFVTDTLEEGPWVPTGTFVVTPLEKSIEVFDDFNLRFIKLAEPLRNDFTWSGNSYIDTKTAGSPYQYMDGWMYRYQNTGGPFTVEGGTFDNTITVLQQDETSPPGPFDPTAYKQRNYSIEVYASGVGLIYKDFLHWTWQTTPPPARFENDSYGIRLSLIGYR